MEKNKKTVACIGDSITYGYGILDTVIDSYPATLQRLLGNIYEVKNFGANGTTVLSSPCSYSMTVECENALNYGADINIFELGTNDLLYIPGRESEFIQSFRLLLHAFLSIPETRLYICSLTPILNIYGFSTDEVAQRHNIIQKLLIGIAEEYSLPFIDLWSPLNDAIGLNPKTLLDGIHPSAEGASIIANCVRNAIIKGE